MLTPLLYLYLAAKTNREIGFQGIERSKGEDVTLSPMRTIPLRSWLLAALSSGLQIAMFPTGGPMPLWRSGLAWIALVPLLIALAQGNGRDAPLKLRQAAALGYFSGTLWYFGNCFWIYQTMYLYGGLPKPVAFGIVILFSLYLGLYHALFAFLFALVRNGRMGLAGGLTLAPFLWVAVELARGRVTGFPWDLLGYTQVSNLLVTRLAPLLGVMGISLFVMAINCGIATIFLFRARAAVWVAVAAIVIAAGLQWSIYGLDRKTDNSDHRAQAVMLQENLSVGVTARGERSISEEERLAEFIRMSLNPEYMADNVQRNPSSQPTILLWPEAPSHLQSNDLFVAHSLATLAKRASSPMIAGTLGIDHDPDSAVGVAIYDSATAYQADGTYAGRYDKIHLVPWGEYVPFKEFFSFADKLTEGVGNMSRGHERSVFHLGGRTYGTFICYESIFGDEVRQFAKNGAEVLVNISDDGWYGETGAPWQHLNMARMRAIENNRWVLRATNTGVTTAIDPLGRMVAQAPRHVRGAFSFAFGFKQETTFYTRHGDWFAYLCLIVSLGAILSASLPGRTMSGRVE